MPPMLDCGERKDVDSLSLSLAAAGGAAPLAGSRRRLLGKSRRKAAGLLIDAHRVLVPRPGRDMLLMVPLSLRVGFSLCSRRRPAIVVKQTYPRVGAVSQLAAATACGDVASGVRH